MHASFRRVFPLLPALLVRLTMPAVRPGVIWRRLLDGQRTAQPAAAGWGHTPARNHPASGRTDLSSPQCFAYRVRYVCGRRLDIKVSKHMGVRSIGADYYLTCLPSLMTGTTTNHNNFRYSAGVNFMFGAQ
jgi:hypothetical protein